MLMSRSHGKNKQFWVPLIYTLLHKVGQ